MCDAARQRHDADFQNANLVLTKHMKNRKMVGNGLSIPTIFHLQAGLECNENMVKWGRRKYVENYGEDFHTIVRLIGILE